MVKRLRHAVVVGVLAVGSYGLLSPIVPVHATSDPIQVTATPALFPGWSSSIYNYVVTCNNNPVSLQVTAAAGYTVSVDGQPAQGGTFSATTGPLAVGQQFTIEVISTSTTWYSVRCLPSDFPTYSVHHNGTPQSRFYIATPSISLGTAKSPYIAVFDTNGVPRWWMAAPAGDPSPLNAFAQPNGNLVWDYVGAGGTGGVNFPEERKLDGTLVRTYTSGEPNGSAVDFHDIQFVPDGSGDYFVSDFHKTVQSDLAACGKPGTTGPITDPVIQEMSADGKTVLWSWDTMDHIPLTEVAPAWYGLCTKGGDAYHWNAIEYSASDSAGGPGILLSYRGLDAVYSVDMASKNILFKLGGSTRPESLTVVGDPATTGTGTGDFGGQHDVRLFNGNLTLHDNGTDRSRPPRAVRYAINTTKHTATLLETVTDPSISSSACCGSARKIDAGNWVVSWGGNGQIDELSPKGASIVFSLTFANGIFSYRAVPVLLTGRYAVPSGWGNALWFGMNTQHPRASGAGKPAA